jgi:arsenical resistance protein ArsH
LYGSARERSYSHLLTEEAARLLRAMGAEPRIFDPRGLPLPDDAPESHPKVQIDWIPLTVGAVRPTQGKTTRVGASCACMTGVLAPQVQIPLNNQDR